MATACASWLFHESAKFATNCLMAAVSASRLDAICARELAAENVRNNKTASAAFDANEIIAHPSWIEFRIRAGSAQDSADCRHHTTNTMSLPPAKLPTSRCGMSEGFLLLE